MEKPKFSLGWELEATQPAHKSIDGIDCGRDGSVNDKGLEYRLYPEFVNTPKIGIEKLKQLVLDPGIEVDESCGYHVHIGIQNRPHNIKKLWAAWFVTLGQQIEDQAFATVPPSRRDNSYCRKWYGVHVPQGLIGQRYSSNKGDNHHRYQWINVTEMFRERGIRTVEIRLMGHCSRFTYLLSWTCFCLLMADKAFSLMEDPSRLSYEAENLKRELRNMQNAYGNRMNQPTNGIVPYGLMKQTGLIEDHRPLDNFRYIVHTESNITRERNRHATMRGLYHRPFYDDETGSMITPRSPARNCLCNDCQAARIRRNQRREEREQARELAALRERERIREEQRLALTNRISIPMPQIGAVEIDHDEVRF